MNTRICSVIAVVTLMSLSSGCSGVRNFLFGRGARCGLCTSLSNVTPQFGNTMQAPCGQQPYVAPAPTQNPSGYSGVATAPRRGCLAGRLFGRQTATGESCGTCNTQYPMNYGDCGCINDCGCGGVVDSYGPVVSDPYMSGEIIGGSQQIIGSPTYPSNVAPIQSDDFSARKFDSDGNRILWEEPLPSGSTAL